MNVDVDLKKEMSKPSYVSTEMYLVRSMVKYPLL